MKLIRKLKTLVLLLVFSVVLTGNIVNVDAKEKEPSLNAKYGTVYMYNTDTLYVNNVPAGVKSITWRSSDKKILTVKSYSKIGRECILKPVSKGRVTVTCVIRTFDEEEFQLSAKITVDKATPVSKLVVNGKNILKSKKTVYETSTTKSSVKVYAKPKDGWWNLEEFFYEEYSSPTKLSSVKNVPSTKKVPVGKYKTDVTIVLRNLASEASYTYTITIYKKSATTTPKFSAKSGNIFLKTKNNELAIKNALATDKITWKSSKKSVAKIEAISGVKDKVIVKPVKAGKTTITCKVVRGKKTYNLSYTLYVRKKVAPFSLIEVDGDNVLEETSTNYYSMKVRDYSMRVQSYENSGWTIISERYIQYTTPTLSKAPVNIVGEGDVPVGQYKTTCLITAKNKKTGYKYTFTLDLFNINYQK